MKSSGDVPTARSGHSFTSTGKHSYLLYGGIDNAKKQAKVQPCKDVYSLKIGKGK